MTEVTLNEVKSNKCAGGWVRFYEHDSTSCQCPMTFSVFVPAQAEQGPVPVLYWLSGLTCTAENFTTKAGAQRYAAEHGVMLVAPDTSPRGLGLPGEDDDWDFGSGAGFYLNATQAPWAGHYNMEDYVIKELPALINQNFPTLPKVIGVSGHSMGGHGALSLSLRYPEHFVSVSAFSPICAPIQCPWGQKAFSNYLGADKSLWQSYDTCELVARSASGFVSAPLIDQGTQDGFLEEQLKPELLQKACDEKGVPVQIRMQEGYDHSYYFVASFIGEHIAHHAAHFQEAMKAS